MKKSYRRLDTLRLEDRINPSFTYLPPSYFFYGHDLLSEPSRQAPLDIALSFLHERAGDFNLSPADLAQARVTSQYTDLDSGITHVYFRQTVHGLDVAYADLNVSVTADGRVISAGGGFVPGLLQKLDPATTAPIHDPLQAVTWAAALLHDTNNEPSPGCCCNICLQRLAAFRAETIETTPIQVFMASNDLTQQSWAKADVSREPIQVKLHYVPTADGSAELAWNLIIRTTDLQHWFDLSISDQSGIVLAVADWVDEAAYNVAALPAEHPNDGGFSLVVNPAHGPASPFGWHDTDGQPGPEFLFTRGNNVNAYLDTNNDNQPDLTPPQPNGGPSLNFSHFSHNPAASPTTQQNRDIAVVNLFYWNNLLHDVHYVYGFTPPAGNFQVNNYGLGGAGGDAVNAEAQDGGGTNNANFATPPDGQVPRMQMYIWTQSTPNRDSSLDNGIIIHEYGHGVSNRLTGGPGNSSALNSLQSGGMGEGWSDWHALMLTQKPTDQANDARPIGTYALGQPPNGPGIRRRPYSFNMSINPLTWEAFGTSGTTSYGINKSTAVHATGEIWCSALWDMNWLLINKYGFDANLLTGWQPGNGPNSAGNKLALRLVMDAMKLQPANPSFIQARDAILAADTNLTGGANHLEIWTAFARRGLGQNAATAGATSNTVTVDFTVPASVQKLNVRAATPGIGSLVTTAPTSFTLTLSNPVDPATLQPADFTVNGVPATSLTYTPGSLSITFNFTASPVTTQGLQTMAIAAGAFTRASDNDPVQAFQAWFRFDALPLAVLSAMPVSGSTTSPPLNLIELNFNEPVDPASVTPGSLSLSRGVPIGVSFLNGNQTVRFGISGVQGEGLVAFSIGPNSVLDSFGNPGTPFTGTVTIDFDTVPMPTFSPVAPLGSRIYESTSEGLISSVSDVDRFTFPAAAGQRVSILVEPEPGLRPTVVLRDQNDQVIFSVTSPAAGTPALLQSALLPADGIYSIAVSTLDMGLGGYTVRAVLNAAIEREGPVPGVANETIATAQNLDDFFSTQTTALGSGSRVSVLGTTDKNPGFELASVPFVFNDISLTGSKSTAAVGDNATDTLTPVQLSGFMFPFYGKVYDKVSFSTNGLITFNGANNSWTPTDFSNGPPEPAIAVLWADLVVDNTGTGTGARNIFWRVDGTGKDQTLTIQWNNVRRVTSTTTFFTFQSVLRADGTIQFNYTESLSKTFAATVGTVGVKDGGTDDPARLVVSYKQANGTFVGPSKSTRLTPIAPPADYFSFTLAAGDSATLAAQSRGTGTIGLEIRDLNDNVLASGSSGAANLSQVVSNFSGMPATYYARITGIPNTPYTLLVQRDAAFDVEPNDAAATAQPLGQAAGAFGHLHAANDPSDWYTVVVPAHRSFIQVETATPGDTIGQPINTLNPAISLFSLDGAMLLANGTPLPDGRNERLELGGLTPGASYRLRVSAQAGTSGEYFLSTRFPDPPAIESVVINDGAIQRSRLTSITVRFTEQVSLAPAAFQLSNGTFSLTSGPSGAIAVSSSLEDGKTAARLTFQAAPGVQFGSLADGIWQLTIPPGVVTSTHTGQANFNPLTIGAIKRLFGDFNGNGTVETTDFASFGNEFGNLAGPSSSAAAFDFDSNGLIDALDFGEFGNRFGLTL